MSHRHSQPHAIPWIALVILLLSGPALAETTTVEAFDTGSTSRVRPVLGHPATLHPGGILLARTDDGLPDYWRGYAKFDLTSIGREVVDAQLVLELDSFASPRPYETVVIHDVASDPLHFGVGDCTGGSGGSLPASQALWEDLGTGLRYGTGKVAAVHEGVQRLFPLNDDAVININAAIASGGIFAVGLRMKHAYLSADHSITFEPGGTGDVCIAPPGAIGVYLELELL